MPVKVHNKWTAVEFELVEHPRQGDPDRYTCHKDPSIRPSQIPEGVLLHHRRPGGTHLFHSHVHDRFPVVKVKVLSGPFQTLIDLGHPTIH